MARVPASPHPPVQKVPIIQELLGRVAALEDNLANTNSNINDLSVDISRVGRQANVIESQFPEGTF